MLERLSLEDLQQRAAGIVLGRVVSTRTVWQDGTIETETEVAVERSWRGPTRGVIRIRSAGGRLPGRRLVVRGAPSFVIGERVLLFLYESGGAWRPVGMFQGVWRLPAATPIGEMRSALAWPSPAAGAALVELRPGPYAVDGGPRPLQALVGDIGGGR